MNLELWVQNSTPVCLDTIVVFQSRMMKCVACSNKVKNFLYFFRDAHLSTMYTNALWGTQARREHLALTKYFNCCCERCSDPTELGTYFSAMKCLNVSAARYSSCMILLFGFRWKKNIANLWKCENFICKNYLLWRVKLLLWKVFLQPSKMPMVYPQISSHSHFISRITKIKMSAGYYQPILYSMIRIGNVARVLLYWMLVMYIM